MRILIADDDPISLLLLKRTLTQWGYDVAACSNGTAALKYLLEEGIHLAILDWEMPEIDGVEVCRRIRRAQDVHTYLVLLSARNTQADVIAGLEAGADDFIRKPFDAAELRARLQTGRRIIELEQSLRDQAIRDPLTGLYNRRYMEETLGRELIRAERKETEVGVILADIDHFKRLNDTHGHQAGDMVLQRVARFLQDQVRAGDVVCRYGGEEFLLILPEATGQVTHARAEKLRRGLSHLEVEHQNHRISPVTISAGVSVFPEHGITAEQLICSADRALYRAKAGGRNCVVVSTCEDLAEIRDASSATNRKAC